MAMLQDGGRHGLIGAAVSGPVCSPPVSAVVGRVHPLERAAAAAVQRGPLAIYGFDDAADALFFFFFFFFGNLVGFIT